jgi:penicillin-binding protein 1A
MSIALGTPEVHPIEMVRGYGAFAANGWLADSLVVTSIKDRHGKVIYEQRPRQKQVIEENTAFLMANMMKGVVERGTATVLKKLGKPMAGKTGTTNDHMDTWFIGYTPEWAFGTWVGFDRKRSIGKQETGGKTAAPVILYFMEEFLANAPALDFDIPDGVIPVPVDLGSGRPVSGGSPGAFIEYFKSGTEPAESEGGGEGGELSTQDYLSGDEF